MNQLKGHQYISEISLILFYLKAFINSSRAPSILVTMILFYQKIEETFKSFCITFVGEQ